MQKITKEQFLDQLKVGIRCFTGYSFSELDLNDLKALSNIRFELCQFHYTNFNESIMPNCKFIRCDFHSVHFNNIENSGTEFRYCEFYNTTFHGMNMITGDFHYCENLELKYFRDADVRNVEIRDESKTHPAYLKDLIEENT